MVFALDRRASALGSLVALTTVFLAACGGSGSTTVDNNGGAGGGGTSTSASTGGGAGGMSAGSPSAKPACENNDPVTGGSPDPRADTAGTLSADGRTFVLFGGDTALPVCG